MTVLIDDFYRSSNGDRWQLLRDTASGHRVLRHEPNLASGGQVTETAVEQSSFVTPERVLSGTTAELLLDPTCPSSFPPRPC
jgi:hypothetical protein